MHRASLCLLSAKPQNYVHKINFLIIFGMVFVERIATRPREITFLFPSSLQNQLEIIRENYKSLQKQFMFDCFPFYVEPLLLAQLG